MKRTSASFFFMAVVMASCLAMTRSTQAQLQITEILYDSTSNPEAAWEWVELRNAGNTPIDLDGFVFDDLSSSAAIDSPNIVSVASGGNAANTMVSANETAILINGGGLGFDELRFRNAWQLSDSVPLISANRFPTLNNSKDRIGLWSNMDTYRLDLDNTDDDDDLEVASLENALAGLDFVEGFPSGSGRSISWSGEGSIVDGANWAATESGTTSVATFLTETQINSTEDIGSPGLLGGFSAPNGLAISEIMYNPQSGEPDWEWVEIFNGSPNTIDFAATPYYFDDLAGSALSAANVDSGRIASGEAAVLVNGSVGAEIFDAAWGNEINVIEVGAWQSLNNGSDTIGLWSSDADYADDQLGDERTFDLAVTNVNYADGSNGWPSVSGGESIQRVDFNDDSGLGWARSEEGDGDSFFASAVNATQPDHAGGDVGTPGMFGAVTPGGSIDFNNDGMVNATDANLLCSNLASSSSDVLYDVNGDGQITFNDMVQFRDQVGALPGDSDLSGTVNFADFVALSANFGQAGTHRNGDSNCDGQVNFADFVSLSGNFGKNFEATAASVPEPTSFLWTVFAGLVFAGAMRSNKTA